MRELRNGLKSKKNKEKNRETAKRLSYMKGTSIK
jgi:hypothetical protein